MWQDKLLISELGQFVRYCVVGGTGTFIDLVCLYIFVDYFHISVIAAATISFLLAVVNNYTLKRVWTFRSKSKNYQAIH